MSAPWGAECDPDGEALAAEQERDYCKDNGLCPKCHAQDLTERVVDGWKHEQCNACGEIV